MTQAPPAIVALAATYAGRPDRAKSYVMAGIVGNAAHMSPPEGYHVSARDEHFNWGGYSLKTARDQAGGRAFPDYASAWDLHFDPADMVLVTTRLITAAKNPKDNRLHGVAEIAGTTNDHTVHAYYENTETDDPADTGGWDSGHLTHVHLSISRDDCNNYAALAPILDVLCGVPLESEDSLSAAEVQELKDYIDAKFAAGVSVIAMRDWNKRYWSPETFFKGSYVDGAYVSMADRYPPKTVAK